MGSVYHHGRGVPQDYEAVKWLLKAAEQGHAFAQSHLGHNYQNGRGVIQDFVQAHAWLNVASANGWSKASKDRDELAKNMTPEQIAKAQELAKEYFEKYQPEILSLVVTRQPEIVVLTTGSQYILRRRKPP